MPRSAASPVTRITHLFMDLDGGEMETVLDIFRAVHARRTASLKPGSAAAKPAASAQGSRPAQKPQARQKANAKPSAPASASQSDATDAVAAQ